MMASFFMIRSFRLAVFAFMRTGRAGDCNAAATWLQRGHFGRAHPQVRRADRIRRDAGVGRKLLSSKSAASGGIAAPRPASATVDCDRIPRC
jgi:hypothetical protein